MAAAPPANMEPLSQLPLAASATAIPPAKKQQFSPPGALSGGRATGKAGFTVGTCPEQAWTCPSVLRSIGSCVHFSLALALDSIGGGEQKLRFSLPSFTFFTGKLGAAPGLGGAISGSAAAAVASLSAHPSRGPGQAPAPFQVPPPNRRQAQTPDAGQAARNHTQPKSRRNPAGIIVDIGPFSLARRQSGPCNRGLTPKLMYTHMYGSTTCCRFVSSRLVHTTP